MQYKGAKLGHLTWSEPYSRDLHLPPDLLRARPQKVKNYYKSTPKSGGSVNRSPRIRSRKRRANYKPFLVLAPTIVLGLLMVRLLLSFLPTFVKAVAPQQVSESPNKVAVLPSPVQVNPPATPPVVAIRCAIVEQESSAAFQALNHHSKALGLAQIMPANLSNWSQDILGYRLTRDQFLNSPELQLKIIDHKLSEYWQEALADSGANEELAVLRVASKWYSGNPNRYKSMKQQWYKGTDGRHRYPSVWEYSNSVLEKYRQYRRDPSKVSRLALIPN